ncbi:14751_t:CDS:2 [Acaulospora morrowiae]|uniref:14751_t:CDS:1 n=1 Tax=Acaulospora morrowiae TaxID=94023 RepID=A0A9N9FLM3_9GLOM|nr:14751_t:CDS:2 [Acaulospora morrowiae]
MTSKLRLKLLYVFFLAALCSAGTYMSIFLSKNLLLTKTEIGLLFSVTPFVEFFSSGLWTSLADKYNTHRIILLSCISCTTMFLIAIPTFGRIYGFAGLIIYYPIISLFSGGISPLVDNFTLGTLKKSGEQIEYGKQRLWGTISCGIIASVMGYLIDRTSIYIIFVGYMCSMSAFAICIYYINPIDFEMCRNDTVIALKDMASDDGISLPKNNSYLSTITFELLRNPRFMFFLFIVLSIAVAKAVAATYLFLYLSEYFKASGTLLGLSSMMGVSLEVVFFYFSKHIMALMGPKSMLIVGQLALIVRLGLYGFLGTSLNPWMALPIEMGILFALVWPAGVEITYNFAPKSLRATSLGIFSGVFNGLAYGIGSIIGGFIYSKFGPIKMFQATTLLSLFTLILYIVTEKLFVAEKEVVHLYTSLDVQNDASINLDEENDE